MFWKVTYDSSDSPEGFRQDVLVVADDWPEAFRRAQRFVPFLREWAAKIEEYGPIYHPDEARDILETARKALCNNAVANDYVSEAAFKVGIDEYAIVQKALIAEIGYI